MPPSSRYPRAFTLIEMLVVMAVIAILAALILSINGLVQSKAARTRAEAEIRALSAGCDSYKADNGSYPQNTTTDGLDPRSVGTPSSYQQASLFLYKELSGDQNANGRNEPAAATPEGKNYLPDFFTPQRLSGTQGGSGAMVAVSFIKDPYGNSYGYSTKAAAAEQKYRTDVTKDSTVTRPAGVGYNPTFDLWSTGGKVANPITADLGTTKDITNSWIKNW
jgi:prepilin-type N-terminal cleavage/methylation domain-containing protein